ncbi:hypothetical protein ALC57_10132 [Trachymyrmex cornetzi]|uniref:Uncharacterized protein n=1 Tax=Trachymyrmex cornetzi TaxID=471704 RepID=A0A151J4N3_9HYME|nr:hypothetical protein ALC57_10132 [Trachymyrmex cornetzi]
MDDLEKAAWLSFRDVAQNFLGNQKSDDYVAIVANMISNFRRLGCLMNLKLHFLDSHISYFPENLGDYSEEQGERFHQDLKEIERRWQGKWDVNMMAETTVGSYREIPKMTVVQRELEIHYIDPPKAKENAIGERNNKQFSQLQNPVTRLQDLSLINLKEKLKKPPRGGALDADTGGTIYYESEPTIVMTRDPDVLGLNKSRIWIQRPKKHIGIVGFSVKMFFSPI